MYAKGSAIGFCYPTVRYARCPAYKPCAMCRCCVQYNQHDPICRICESRKRNWKGCGHDQETIQFINHKMGVPIFDPNRAGQESTVRKVIAEDSEMQSKLDKLAPQQEVLPEKPTPRGFVPGVGSFETKGTRWTGSG